MNELKQLIANGEYAPTELAKRFNMSELDILRELDVTQVAFTSGNNAQLILNALPNLGSVTTIISVAESIFEIKGPFPKGIVGHGYFNLQNEQGLQGHLKLANVENIAFVSRPRRNKPARYIGFYADDGHCIWKIYLGRNSDGELFESQLLAFDQLKEDLTHG